MGELAWLYYESVQGAMLAGKSALDAQYEYNNTDELKNDWGSTADITLPNGGQLLDAAFAATTGNMLIRPSKIMTDNGYVSAILTGTLELGTHPKVICDGFFSAVPLKDFAAAIMNSAHFNITTDVLVPLSVAIASKIYNRQVTADEIDNMYVGQRLVPDVEGNDECISYVNEAIVQAAYDAAAEAGYFAEENCADVEVAEAMDTSQFPDESPLDLSYALYIAAAQYINATTQYTGSWTDQALTARHAITSGKFDARLAALIGTGGYNIVEFAQAPTSNNAYLFYYHFNDKNSLPRYIRYASKVYDPTSDAFMYCQCQYSDDGITWFNNVSGLNDYADQSGSIMVTVQNDLTLDWSYGGTTPTEFIAGSLALWGQQHSTNIDVARGYCSNITITKEYAEGTSAQDLLTPERDLHAIDDLYPGWTDRTERHINIDIQTDDEVETRDIPIDIGLADALAQAGVIARPYADVWAGDLAPAIPYPNIATITDLYDYLNRVQSIDGTRALDITSDPPSTPTPLIPAVPTLGGNAKLYTVHQMSVAQLDALGNYMWSNDFISLIEHMFTNPADAVIGLHTLYYGGSLPAGGAEQIKLGSITATGVTGQPITNRYMEFSCGTVHVQSYYGNVEDYDPYTKVQIFLPFIGFRDLATNEVMGGNVTVKYAIDIYTGACVAFVTVLRDGVSQALYTFEGNCALTEPLTGADYSRVISGLIGLGVGVATGGVGAAIGAVGMLTNKNIQYTRSGSFSANAGAMGVKTPYILIRRPIAYDANFYSEFYGNPSNNTVSLGSCSGYTRVKDVHVDHISCTDDERAEIVALLKKGVIF